MTVQIPLAVKTLGSATGDVAFEATVVGFEMFTVHPSAVVVDKDRPRLDLREITSSHKGLRACGTRQWFGMLE